MNQIDFLPRRIRQQRGVYRQVRRQAMTMLIVAATLGVLAYFNEARIAKANTDLATYTERGESLAAELSVLPELTRQLADGQINRRISRELGSRLTINALMAELARMLPPKASLTSLDCSTIEVQPTVKPGKPRTPRKVGSKMLMDKRVRLQITGIAPTAIDVADFIGRLSVSPLFSDVNMGYAKTVLIDNDRREARSFQMTFLVAK